MPPWPAAGSTPTGCATCSPAPCHPPTRWCSRVDVTTWPRCDAECSPERGFYYHPSRHSAGQPIIAGWASQWIGRLSFDRDSWTAPVDAARLRPLDDTGQQAAVRVRALLGRLPAGGPVPVFVFDGGYDSAQLTLDLAEERVAVLVRLRAGRCFYADPPPVLRRPATSGALTQRRSATPPRRQVQLRRPDHLAHPHRHPDLSGRPVRQRDRGGLERAASQTAAPPRPRQPRTPTDRARHHPPRPGRASPGPHPPTQGAVAVVVRPRRARPGPGLAGLHPPVRPGNSLYASDKTACGCCRGWSGSRSGSPLGRRSPRPGRSAAPPAGAAARTLPGPAPPAAPPAPESSTGRSRSPRPVARPGPRPPAPGPAGRPPAGQGSGPAVGRRPGRSPRPGRPPAAAGVGGSRSPAPGAGLPVGGGVPGAPRRRCGRAPAPGRPAAAAGGPRTGPPTPARRVGWRG